MIAPSSRTSSAVALVVVVLSGLCGASFGVQAPFLNLPDELAMDVNKAWGVASGRLRRIGARACVVEALPNYQHHCRAGVGMGWCSLRCLRVGVVAKRFVQPLMATEGVSTSQQADEAAFKTWVGEHEKRTAQDLKTQGARLERLRALARSL